jgi:uncharacterized membrane protein YdjX (TVP38/TMEM64 family)
VRYQLLLSVLVILGLWITAWGTGVAGYFTPDSIRRLLAGKGLWGILVFTGVFSAGQLLLRVPGPVFIAGAVALYGRNFGIPVALLGALVSVNVSFAVVRAFAGQPIADIRRPLVRRLLSKIDSRPVTSVALLRLLFQTAPYLNCVLPMTAVRWQDHLAGSALGLPVPVTIIALFFDLVLHRAT